MPQKIAFVTGASSGIGRATALSLAGAGFDLILQARRADRLKELAREIEGQGRRAHVAAFDLRDQSALETFARDNEKLLNDLDVVVNSAGLARGVEKIQNADLRDWDEMMDTNVTALMRATRVTVPFLLKRNKGTIVNIGSVAGRWVYPGGGVYCATKFAVRAFTEGLRMDLLGTGVRVINIEPGMVNTEFSAVRLKDQAAADRVYEKMTPLSAQDIAESILWCVLRPAHVNIQELVIFPTDQAAVGQVYRHKE